MDIQIRKLSSLAKVFKKKIYGKAYSDEIVCKGEDLSFQIAIRSKSDINVYLSCNSEFKTDISRVGFVPSNLPAYPTSECPRYLTKKPGSFPDPLFPIGCEKNAVTANEWTTFFITVKIPKDCAPGKKNVSFTLSTENIIISRSTFSFEVLPFILPEQRIDVTQWFHCDCIADAHGVKIFSEKHWELIEKYMKVASEHGMTSILTPIFTPPLDTKVGSERPTVQLVKVEYDGKKYFFDFSLLERYTALAQKCGIKKLEIAHLFTQWGAAFAPKVVAKVNGKSKKIFGWSTRAMSNEYKTFLSQLIPELIEKLEELGYDRSNVFFHVSDEPTEEHLEAYSKAIAFVEGLVRGYTVIDALSDFEFYQKGLVKHPVVALNHIEPFIQNNVPELWGYYCCNGDHIPNRFMAMPSSRNRIVGMLFYKYKIKGFLQWGYNFYYTQLSVAKINPYECTDAGGAFPSGDAFSVYPYEDGAIPSIRLSVFKNALSDISLLYLIEEKIGREKTVELIDRVCNENITFISYPTDERVFIKLRKEAKKILGIRCEFEC